ncbi:mucin-5AC isoform X4 [Cephus cinctus]|uniref:Mucin-5AC isoform X4 n=1 Tax=Cephus cinctus TaxID=211228 RepID=A0AAJ7BSK6_CEPCN|nr:mucin-5AC isoform X4 [Cephus cinctus]
MEISKSLQEEILSVQSKLKNAIRDHQICVGKLKDDPNNTDILGQIQEIQLHIVSLGRCQKQVVQRLRKEVEDFKADNVNGAKVSVASLLGINNNNHITNNNEDRSELAQSKEINGISRRTSKDDYEEVVHNGDVPSPTSQENDRAKERPYSVETISGEDEVIEVSLDENSHEKPEEDPVEKKIESMEQTTFLGNLGLITIDRFTELQNKRAERKRRSTANPQFVYSNWEIPTKRKRYSYLQSAGNAPQTRQTTARLNGPSPPPSKTSPPKSSSPSTRTPTKSLIPTQKATTRPNILRNAQESKVFPGKGKLENGSSQVQLPSAKSVQSVGSKAVHIPGLPSSLTIERIENDSSVCIHCRNPGTLTICDNCSANYHVSCHSVSPAPSRTCPKCAPKCKDREDGPAMSCKKDDELEEKERERYELRERNSDLRLQVYELEKRSQLLGQSLQAQHRTRQELLGKQEKTQRSIKRLVDFIKLMQLTRDNTSCPTSSASTSFHRQPSSSQSPPIQSPPTPQDKKSPQASMPVLTTIPPLPVQEPSHVQQPPTTGNNSKTPTPRSFSISSPVSRVSPTSSRSPKCPTPTSCPSTIPATTGTAATNRKSINPISSLRKSQSQVGCTESVDCSNSNSNTPPPQLQPLATRQISVVNQKSKINPLASTSSQVQPTTSQGLTISRKLRMSNDLPIQAHVESTPTRPTSPSIITIQGVGKSLPIVAFQRSTDSVPQKQAISQSQGSTTTVPSHQTRLTVESRKASVNRGAQNTKSCESLKSERQSCALTETVSNNSAMTCLSNNWKFQGSQTARKTVSSSPMGALRGTGRAQTVYSTHCSQAINGPISSPVILARNHENRQTTTMTTTTRTTTTMMTMPTTTTTTTRIISTTTTPSTTTRSAPSSVNSIRTVIPNQSVGSLSVQLAESTGNT